MFKEAYFALHDALFEVERKAHYPVLLKCKFVKCTDVSQALTDSVKCKAASICAVFTIGSQKAYFFTSIYVSPVKIMSLQETEEVIQRSASTRPRILRTDRPAKKVIAKELIGLDTTGHRIPEQNWKAWVGLPCYYEILAAPQKLHP